MKAETKSGYKMTELGLIPSDWVVKEIEELTPIGKKYNIVDGPFGSNLKTIHYRNQGIPIITSGYVTDGKFYAKDYLYVDLDKFKQEKRSAVIGGDIVMAKIGERCGASAILPFDHPESILSGNALKITIDRSCYDIWLIKQIFWNYHINGVFDILKTTGAQPAISMANLKRFKIPLPSNLPEQTAIANALKDTDDLINSLEKLIAKKKLIKQGAMQELLKPKEGWVKKTLGEIIETIADYTANGSFESLKTNVQYYEQRNYAVLVRTTDLGKTIFDPKRFTDKKGYDFLSKTSLFGGEIILANVGSIGKVFKVPTYNMPMTLAPNTYLLKFKKEIHEGFIFQWLNTLEFYDKLMSKIGSTTLQAINKDNLREIELSIPNQILEQVQISLTLDEMDIEILNLESKLTKFQIIKQGMMQQLLTGKIRLI
jgi:type I restriction enzyme S subunit